MPNPLFNMLGGNNGIGNMFPNPAANMVNAFNEFRSKFTGNPQQEVQRLLNSGQMTQEQFTQLQSMAQQFTQMMGANK